MELTPGYKQTEVGRLPDDWEVRSLVSLGQVLIGLTYAPSNVSDHGLLVLRSSNIQNGRLHFDSTVYVQMEVPERVITQENDLLICVRNGSRRLIGKCVLIDDATQGAAFGAFMSLFRSDDNLFVVQQFKSETIARQIGETLGATINQITNKDLHAFQIPYPPRVEEREAIAEALSDADALIESLEQLIAKKRFIKQGVMQELLTGKRRLPGFETKPGFKQTELGLLPKDWVLISIKELSVKVGSGVTPSGGSSRYHTSGRPFVRSQNVGWGQLLLEDLAYIDEATHAEFPATELKSDDILLNITGASIGRCAIVCDELISGNVNQHVCIIRVDPDLAVAMFIQWLLLSSMGQGQIASFQAGGNREGLNFGQIRSMMFGVPPTCSEQIEVVQVLYDVDAEIMALCSRVERTRQLKQGMMQQLLTGKIRLT